MRKPSAIASGCCCQSILPRDARSAICAKRSIAVVSRQVVRLSLTFMYRGSLGWTTDNPWVGLVRN